MFLPRFPWPVPARISQAARRAHSAALARPGPSIHDDRLSTTTQAGKPQSRGERLGPGMTREVYVPAPSSLSSAAVTAGQRAQVKLPGQRTC